MSDAGPPAIAPIDWGRPTFPEEVADEQRLVVVDDAIASRFRTGRLRTFVQPDRWMWGAVYDAEERLVVESQRIGGLWGNNLLAADPPRLVGSADGAERLAGTWLYGGNWINHFGHFVLETVPALWPEPADLAAEHGPLAGLVFHKYVGAVDDPFDWQHELLGLTGYGGLPIRVVAQRQLRVERLVVPSRAVVVNGWAHDGANAVWSRMARAAGGPVADATGAVPAPRRRVFFSRTAFNAARRLTEKAHRVRTTPETDRALDVLFADHGFEVIAPESLPVADQVRTVAETATLAGQSGTALHLAAFAGADTHVIEVGDRRNPGCSFPSQRVVDAVRRHRTAYLPPELDLARMAAALVGLGFPRGG